MKCAIKLVRFGGFGEARHIQFKEGQNLFYLLMKLKINKSFPEMLQNMCISAFSVMNTPPCRPLVVPHLELVVPLSAHK